MSPIQYLSTVEVVRAPGNLRVISQQLDLALTPSRRNFSESH